MKYWHLFENITGTPAKYFESLGKSSMDRGIH
jgi:hypothetical protein